MTISAEISDREMMDLIETQAKVRVLKVRIEDDKYVTARDICAIFGWEYEGGNKDD